MSAENENGKPKKRSLFRELIEDVAVPTFAESIASTLSPTQTEIDAHQELIHRVFKYCPFCGGEDVQNYPSSGIITCRDCGADWQTKTSMLGRISIKLKKPAHNGTGTELLGVDEEPAFWQTMAIRRHAEEQMKDMRQFSASGNSALGPVTPPAPVEQVKYCSRCGARNAIAATYCRSCGNRITG